MARRHLRGFEIKGVPTLVRWGVRETGDGEILARVQGPLENAATEAEAARVAQEFVARTKDLRLD